LREIDSRHEEWMQAESEKTPILTINCEDDFENDISRQKEVVD